MNFALWIVQLLVEPMRLCVEENPARMAAQVHFGACGLGLMIPALQPVPIIACAGKASGPALEV